MPESKTAKSPAVNDAMRTAAMQESAEVLERLGCSLSGLTDEEAAARLEQFGPNQVAHEKRQNWLLRLYLAARNPLVILLTILALISFLAPKGDVATGVIMLGMVALGLGLRFVQETRADTAAAKLKAMINVTATVVRNGQP